MEQNYVTVTLCQHYIYAHSNADVYRTEVKTKQYI